MKAGTILVVFCLSISTATFAQDAEDECVSVASIVNTVNVDVGQFLADSASFENVEDAIASIQDLSDRLNTIVTDCASQTGESTQSVVETEEDGTIISGIWFLDWVRDTKVCAADDYVETLTNRTIVLRTDETSGHILLEDLFWIDEAEFAPDVNGGISFLRNETLESGTPISFTYSLTELAPDRIVGTSTDFFPNSGCPSLRSDFVIILVEEGQYCLTGTLETTNLRTGPGTEFDLAGVLTYQDDNAIVVGQALDSSGITWWQLADDRGWIRSDLVRETSLCDQVPVVDPATT